MKLKLPSLKSSKGGEEGAKPAAPKFLSDLYRDLSDRHLLLPLIGLLVAIVAVPMLLSSDPAPPAPAPAVPGDIGDTSALDAAVIVSTPGIRDYRERLAVLREQNPFESPGTASSGGDGSGDGSGEPSTSTGDSSPSTSTGSSTPAPTPSGSGSTSSGSASIDSTPPSTPSTGGATTDPSTSTDTTGTDTTTDPPKPETRFYASRIDVTIGQVGHAKTVEGVRDLEFLPNEKTPIVAYLGLANQNHALFSVNPSVPETEGEGSCAPKTSDTCMYLDLKIGEEQRFVYGEGNRAKIYRLKLLDTEIVRVPDPRDPDKPQDGDGAAQGSE